MKKILLLLVSMILLLSCSDPELKNPFDPDSDYQLDPMSSDFSVVQLTDSQVKLEWQINPTVIGNYTLFRRINSGDYQLYADLSPDTTSYIDNELSVDNRYYYQLIGRNDEVETAPITRSISTEFAAITNIQVNQIDLFDAEITWEHDCDYEDGYILYRQTVDLDKSDANKGVFTQMGSEEKSREFEMIAELPSNTFQYLEEDLELGENYQYNIIAFSQYNQSDTNLIIYPHIIPKPENVTYQRESIISIQLNWTDAINGEDGFRIDRKIGSDVWNEGIGEVEANVTTWTDYTAAVGEVMQYRVVATYNGHESLPGYSPAINNFIPAPENLNYAIDNYQNDHADIILTWDFDLPGIDGYKIERNGVLLDEVVPYGVNQWIDLNIPGGEEYTYRVKAIYQNQSSDYSNIIVLTVALEGMVLIEAGSYMMGDHYEEGQSDELPTHAVNLSDYYIDQYEVTHTQYIEFLNDFGVPSHGSFNGKELIDMDDADCAISHNGSEFYFEATTYAPTAGCAVIEVSWYGAVVYCNWKSESQDLVPCYDLDNWTCNFGTNGYRLPTEAEWEYAARGGSTWMQYLRYSGCQETADLADYAWYNENSNGHSRPVGIKNPNQKELYDMSGNVWEWCNDFYGSSYYDSSSSYNPTGPVSGTERVLRGGSWLNEPSYCRVSNRISEPTEDTNFNIGFRLVKR